MPFATTRWSVVLAAGERRDSASQEALSTLCEAYWYPLYAFARRLGHPADRAEELTQAFFAKLLEKEYLRDAAAALGWWTWRLPASAAGYETSYADYMSSSCPGCGAATVDSLGGLCPACLLSLALAKPDDEPGDVREIAGRDERRWLRLNVLGSGARGITYLAEDTESRVLVSLKIYHAKPGAAETEAFNRRAIALARCQHPQIVPVVGCGITSRGHAFVASEYVPGHTLSRRLDRQVHSFGAAFWLFQQIIAAIRAAHGVGVSHGALTGANVFVTTAAPMPQALVGDFNLIDPIDLANDLAALGRLLRLLADHGDDETRRTFASIADRVSRREIVTIDLLKSSLQEVGSRIPDPASRIHNPGLS